MEELMKGHRMHAQTMSNANRTYLPAAGHDWALPLYDPFVKLLGGETARSLLVEQAALQRTHRVLDIGCGTGTLAIRIKQVCPDATVVGLDPDPKALVRARRKAQGAGTSIQFDQAFADELPYPAGSFDRVLSSFMFHHLPLDHREETLREVRRVLAPGGSLHLLDFDRPEQAPKRNLASWIHSSKHLTDNSEEWILALMDQAGFVSSRKVMARSMFLGLLRIGYYRASVSVSPNNAE
jgi:ubiquinone/menaquinone biosynthesis C-methylase UbiE